MRIGKPGLLCLEGEGINVDRCMATIKSDSWSEIPPHQKKMSCAIPIIQAFRQLQHSLSTEAKLVTSDRRLTQMSLNFAGGFMTAQINPFTAGERPVIVHSFHSAGTIFTTRYPTRNFGLMSSLAANVCRSHQGVLRSPRPGVLLSINVSPKQR